MREGLIQWYLTRVSHRRTRKFLGEVTERPTFHADPIIWKSDEPLWVDQWPLPEEKVQTDQQFVQEQLNSGHIMPSNFPWNSPIFVLKKNLESVN